MVWCLGAWLRGADARAKSNQVGQPCRDLCFSRQPKRANLNPNRGPHMICTQIADQIIVFPQNRGQHHSHPNGEPEHLADAPASTCGPQPHETKGALFATPSSQNRVREKPTVMLGVIRQRYARPSCMTIAARSALATVLHALSTRSLAMLSHPGFPRVNFLCRSSSSCENGQGVGVKD